MILRLRNYCKLANEQLRLWLEDYVRRPQQANVAMQTIRALRGVLFTGGRKFTRDEMNER